MTNNIYNFTFNDVSEEDIIRGAIESGIAVYLHGKSSEGKSSRIKELDSDAEVIYLRNASPDSLVGKSVYNQSTVEMIDVKPSWLVKLEKKCEAEPNKIHIVFFDELSHALHVIQGMAFNIIFDREVNGKWHLPDNARIAAAGNELEDNVAANTLAEPLFNRFAHVYIETTLDKWLEWAKTPRSTYSRLDYIKHEKEDIPIHPAIFTFISSKKAAGVNILRTKYDGIKPNADPRKWEMASTMLYNTNNPEMLRSLVGETITKDFVNFCKIKIVSIDDVISGRYTDEDYNGDISKKYATATVLSEVDDDNIEVVRDFVKKMGLEVLTLFDELWIKGNKKRELKIEELRTMGLAWRRK